MKHYIKSYNPKQLDILNEAVSKLLAECQSMLVRNNLNGGNDLTEEEVKVLHDTLEFLGREHLDMLRFLLDCQNS